MKRQFWRKQRVQFAERRDRQRKSGNASAACGIVWAGVARKNVIVMS
jgi:hypothetical protein